MSGRRHGAARGAAEEALRGARGWAGAGTALLLLLTAGSGLLARRGGAERLVVPAAMLGLVGPVLGYRLYLYLLQRASAVAAAERRCRAFRRATLAGLGVTTIAAAFGLAVFAFSGALEALFGVATHVLLTGAVWPTEQRLEDFLDSTPSAGTDG